MSVPPDKMRFANGAVRDHTYVYNWQLTHSNLIDPVRLILPPDHVLPVILVPGIMGTNLMSKDSKKAKVWRLDSTFGQPAGQLGRMIFKGPGARQKLMHPERTEVDPRGAVPSKLVGSIHDVNAYRNERYWGEVGEGSYHAFLTWLEQKLNGQGYNPARWSDFTYTSVSAKLKPGERAPEPKLYPGIAMDMRNLPAGAEIGMIPTPVMSDDLLARAKFRMPVYACGYNWLDSNKVAAERLRDRINAIIKASNGNGHHCKQVIVVTHSMGGLVTRRCAQLEGMKEAIAGVVHGVMPSIGAAVAYRRCKVGMGDEDALPGQVIGRNGREVTAVFAQAPGALQLLPTGQYRSRWLKLKGANGTLVEQQPASGDPYQDIYLCRNRWWGLVREEWLRPSDGVPLAWDKYEYNIGVAKGFHHSIIDSYHPNTYVFYGADSAQKSFETIEWNIRPGLRPDRKTPPSEKTVGDMGFGDVRDDGTNPSYVGGKLVVQSSYSGFGGTVSTYETSYWELNVAMQDGGGDGTVPISSGEKPMHSGGSAIQQQFRLKGFAHEGAYRSGEAQWTTLYCLQKIAAKAKVA